MIVKFGNITCAAIQMVGNKANGEGVTFATNMSDMTESSDFIKTLVNNVFKFDDIRHFDFVESIELNPVFTFVSKIFEDKNSFIKQSNNLARYLYDQSLHPNIKNGEFYTMLIQKVLIDSIETDALLMLKSEKKDSFLTLTTEEGRISVKTTLGLGLKQIDKGCIVFNVKKEDGYIVCVVDNTNYGMDAHYWTDSFLHVAPYDDDFHKTKQVLDFCKSFVGFMKKKQPTQKIETAIAFGDIAETFRKGETITLKQVEQLMSFTDEASHYLSDYKEEYEKRTGALPKSFQVDMGNSFKNINMARMRTIKIGRDYELRILNPSVDIEQGFDSTKKKSYYKLFFE